MRKESMPKIVCTGERPESGFILEMQGKVLLTIIITEGKATLTFGARNDWRSGLTKGRAHTLRCTEVIPKIIVDDHGGPDLLMQLQLQRERRYEVTHDLHGGTMRIVAVSRDKDVPMMCDVTIEFVPGGMKNKDKDKDKDTETLRA